DLNRKDARMKAGQLAEERLMQGILEEEREVGVIRYRDDIDAGFGRFLNGRDDLVAFSCVWCVAGRVVREVQNDDRLAAALVLACQQRVAQTGAVEPAAAVIQRILDDLGSASDAECQFIVLPIL